MGQYRYLTLVVTGLFASSALWTGAEQGKTPKTAADRAETDYAALLPRILPKSPAEALKTFRLHPRFRIELAAAEPNVASPVAVDFDENGRLYVAEFRDFNQDAVKKPRGRIRLLEDTDGDGVYDKSTIFLDDLDSPTAVCCYDGGVFVGSVPNILYAKDTDGDGKADIRRVVFTGFSRDAGGEALFNSFRWHFDNRIHVQTSTSGGTVRHAERKDKPVSVRGQGFLFDPRTEAFAVTSGGGQHGMSIDDWGRKFVCTSHDPIFLCMYDSRYLARNPFLEAPAAAVRIAGGGYNTKVFRISPNEPWRVLRTRWRTTGVEPPHPTEGDEPSGYFSAASGVTIFRGDAWPAEYRGNVFVGEPSNNLVYRARLEPSGVGLVARRADPKAEFLASTDIWFRPVQFASGPDGALYVLDMYRELIEAAEFMPPSITKHMDIAAGFDHGRIYRIVPENFHRPAPPALGKASSADLVKLLAHPNGWHRDTASRLLYQRQDKATVAPLRRLAAESDVALGRMHALYALDGLESLAADTVLRRLSDTDARVREHALRLAEQFASTQDIGAKLEQMTDDPDLGVRYQLAYSLGAFPGEISTQALAKLARRDGSDSWFQLAILSSVNSRAGDIFRLLVEDKDFRASRHGRELLGKLATLIGNANREKELAAVVQGLERLPQSEQALSRELVRNVLTKLPASGRSQFVKSGGGRVAETLSDLLRDARVTAPDEKRATGDRAAAVRMLGLASFADVQGFSPRLLNARQPEPVQAAIIETLASFDEPAVPALLFEAWPGLSPKLRASAVETLLSRPAWIVAFCEALEQSKINRGDVDPARIQALQTHADSQVRARAAKLFAQAKLGKRQDVVARYQKVLQLQGDRARGQEVFKNVCSACHLLEGVGTQVGADLTAIRDQATEAILINILDPNREVKPQFLSYHLMTDTGRLLTGMIAAETPTSLTIRRADGTTETVLRIRIDDLRSTGLSFMPEGLEQQVDVAAMADLLAYLKSVR